MNWGVLIAVLIYEVVSIVGIGAFMAYKNKKSGGAESGSFAFAGGGLPASLVGITLALTLLGSAHNWGTCQNAASMGVIAAWFGIACVIMMVVITQITGPWIRRTGAKTIGDFLNKVFGKVPGTMISCVNAALSIARTGWSRQSRFAAPRRTRAICRVREKRKRSRENLSRG